MNLAMLVAMSLSWSSIYLFVKLVQGSMPPITAMAVRACVALVATALISVASGRDLRQPGSRQPTFLAVGVLCTTLLWMGIACGEEYISAGLAALLTTVIPISTYLLNVAVLHKDRATPLPMLGLALGVAGLATVIGPNGLANSNSLLGVAMVAGGALAYAIGGLIAADRLYEVDALVTTTYTMLYGMVTLAAAAFLFENPLRATPSTGALGALVAMGTLATAIPSLLYFLLVRRAGAFYTSTFGYLVPIFGVVLGIVFRDEPYSARTALGMAITLSGIYLVNRR